MSVSGPTIVRLPNRHRAREEASLWLARLDRGLGEAERDELDAWLADDPLHADTLLSLAALWDQTAVLSELAELFPLERPNSRRFVRGRRFAVAALGFTLLGGSAFFLYDASLQNDVAPDAAYVYETAVGGQSTVSLPDGSVVTLNTDSSMEVRYSASQRAIVLDRGEGFFAVEPDSSRPFRVHAGGRTFEAVGTAFNVRVVERANEVKMLVTEGRVGLLPDAVAETPRDRGRRVTDAMIVDAGNLAIVDAVGVSILPLDGLQMEAQLSWQQGMLIFDGEPLESVLREMSRYTSMEFVVDDSVRDLRVGGYFRAGDVDGLLIALRENFDIQASRTADGRTIVTASP